MSRVDDFGVARDVAITVLVDNRADLLVKQQDGVKRFKDEPLQAEHGFAALLELDGGARTVLWDAGISSETLVANMCKMEIDATQIDVVALSHGHGDHTAGMEEAFKAADRKVHGRRWEPGTPMSEILAGVEAKPLEVVLHPAALRERWGKDEEGAMYGPRWPVEVQAWEAAGARIVTSEVPYRLGPGCWTSGYVPRRSFEKSGRGSGRFYREGREFLVDDIEDDQAIFIHVGGKGLIVQAGCAHAGIVNTIRYGQKISGIDRVWAVLGGFHLAPADEDEVQQTIDFIKALEPALVAPTHCTGFPAISEFARRMPEAFVECVVGTTFEF